MNSERSSWISKAVCDQTTDKLDDSGGQIGEAHRIQRSGCLIHSSSADHPMWKARPKTAKTQYPCLTGRMPSSTNPSTCPDFRQSIGDRHIPIAAQYCYSCEHERTSERIRQLFPK